MINKKIFRSRNVSQFLAALIFCFASGSGIARAQLYVVNSIADPTGSTIASYNLNGTAINSDLVTVTGDDHVLQGLARSGNTLFATDSVAGTVSAFNADSGATAGGFTTIAGLVNPIAVAISGSSLFVLTYSDETSSGAISQYTTSGSLVNATLITLLTAPGSFTVSGGNIYVTNLGDGNAGSGSISQYTTGGATVDSDLVTGLDSPIGLTLYGGNIFVTNSSIGTIGSYNATTGVVVNAALVSGLDHPWALTNSDETLYFTDVGTGKIGSFNVNTTALNTNLVSGLEGPTGLVAVPEPREWSLLGVALVMLVAVRRMQVRRQAFSRIPVSRR